MAAFEKRLSRIELRARQHRRGELLVSATDAQLEAVIAIYERNGAKGWTELPLEELRSLVAVFRPEACEVAIPSH